MRRLFTSIFFASLTISVLHAQHIEQPFSIGVLFGPAFPVGKFASTGLDSSKIQSAAKTGLNAAITLTYHFPNSIFSIYAMGSWQQNGVDTKALAKTLMSGYSDTISLAVDSKSWRTWAILVGPRVELPLDASRKCRIEFSFGGGIQQAIVPYYTITQYYTNGSDIGFYYGGSLNPVFCYQFGSGFSYHVNRFWSLTINASYTHSTSVYNNNEYGAISDNQHFVFPISSVNLLAGISYSF